MFNCIYFLLKTFERKRTGFKNHIFVLKNSGFCYVAANIKNVF